MCSMVLLQKPSSVRSLVFVVSRSYGYLSKNFLQRNYIQTRSLRTGTMVANKYEEAISALNGLQSNAATIQNIRLHGDSSHKQLPDTIKYLARAGITLDTLDQLSVIHITGTKGKGSTCAFTEQILRKYGYKTGLYTSPHLVSVTERIRINGQPIARDEYTKHFWDVYNALYCKRENPNDMPAYFKFLTVLAMKIFLEEQVDVAVLEVGIGGEYDCTNVVRKPVVCGITTLDLDHTSLLGNTLESIAWHKAGIIKAGAGVFTVEGHRPEVLQVLEERASLKQCKVLVCPGLAHYSSSTPLQLGLAGYVQHSNASLALQLARYWLCNAAATRNAAGGRQLSNAPLAPALRADGRSAPAFELTAQEIQGLRDVVWPGRSQVFPVDDKFTFFLDGAHTSQSMEACARWFLEASEERLRMHRRGGCVRVLWFNATGDRDVQTLLRRLLGCRFNLALFTTNNVSQDPKFADQINRTVSGRSMLLRCQANLETWQYLTATRTPCLAQESQSGQHSNGQELQIASRSSAVEQRPDSHFKTSDDANRSGPLRSAEKQALNLPCADEIPAEERCFIGENGGKSVVRTGEESERLHCSRAGGSKVNFRGTRRILDASKGMKSKSSGSDFKTGRENSYRSSSLPNSKLSLEAKCDHDKGDRFRKKNSPEKRRSNVLQENVLAPKEIPGRESFSGRTSAKESKLDSGHSISGTDVKNKLQNEIPVKGDSQAEHVSKSSGRHAGRSTSLPLDPSDTSLTHSVSLDRTHMLQLASATAAEDECDSSNDAAVVIPYIQDAVNWLRSRRRDTQRSYEDHGKLVHNLTQDSSVQEALADADHVHVLVTGSLHLVGGVLAVLDPSLTNSMPQRRPTNPRRVFYSSPGTP